MSTPFEFKTSFKLDKAHFAECFDESVVGRPMMQKYRNAMILAVVGLLLIFVVGTNQYAAFFVVAVAALEALSVYYKRTWWLWRQMLSKAYNHQVDLIIDEQGITTKSFHVNSKLDFNDVSKLTQSDVGLLLTHSAGVSYISKQCLTPEVVDFITNKISS